MDKWVGKIDYKTDPKIRNLPVENKMVEDIEERGVKKDMGYYLSQGGFPGEKSKTLKKTELKPTYSKKLNSNDEEETDKVQILRNISTGKMNEGETYNKMAEKLTIHYTIGDGSGGRTGVQWETAPLK